MCYQWLALIPFSLTICDKLVFMDHKGRLARLRHAMDRHQLDALLITNLPNIQYLCGFTGSSGALLVADSDAIFFTDGRYAEQAHAEVQSNKIRIVKKSALAAATQWLVINRSRRIGIESVHLTVAERTVVATALGRRSKLINAPPIVEDLRQIKDVDEIARIRAACQLGVELFDRLKTLLRPGIFEVEVAGDIEFVARKRGVEQMAFPTIIAGGRRSALPHGRASTASIPSRGFVVCDFGVILAGYCSDMTRTVHVGPPQPKARRVYNAVREAQQAALEAVRPGAAAGEVDRAARNALKNIGLGKFFSHSTGHGVGLEIHEEPRIAAGQKESLQTGTVITIEPGAYLPGEWGVRIEDTVVVTETGCDILTACSKDLITI
jgi:Xaa-Pro aminopeptidase